MATRMGHPPIFPNHQTDLHDIKNRRFRMQREEIDYPWDTLRSNSFHETRCSDHDGDGTVHLPETLEMSNMQRYLQCHEQRPYFNPVSACYRGPAEPRSYAFHDVEMQPPWSHKPMMPSVPPPFGSQGDHRSSIDQDSLSSGSVWSPRTNEPYADYDTGCDRRISTPCDGLGYSSEHHFYPPFAIDSPGGHVHSFQSIVPSEVQFFPDTEPEAEPDREDFCPDTRLQDGAMNAPYYTGAPELAHHSIKPEQSIPEDEGIGSSIDDGSVDSPRTEDDDMEMEDNKDVDTDYKPSRRNKPSSTRRTSRTSNGGHKSPIKQRRGSNKVTKPTRRTSSSVSSKNWTHCLTDPASSSSSDNNTPGSQDLASKFHSQNNRNPCHRCPQSYPSPSALNKHIQSSHTRPFTCTFARYGCPSTFGSKNEWKRHVSSQHLRPGIWRCDIDACVPNKPHCGRQRINGRKSSIPGAQGSSSHNDFNRKDLFTQHVRRMHGPLPTAPGAEKERFEEGLEEVRRRCWKSLHEAPPRSVCGFCAGAKRRSEEETAPSSKEGVVEGEGEGEEEKKVPVFEGKAAWEERMEHVGRHLEGQAMEGEDEDVELREWMVKEKLLSWEKGAWRVVGVAEAKKQPGKGTRGQVGASDGDEDAEGDDE